LLFYFNLSILFIFYNICNILGKHCAITQIEQAYEIFIAECSIKIHELCLMYYKTFYNKPRKHRMTSIKEDLLTNSHNYKYNKNSKYQEKLENLLKLKNYYVQNKNVLDK
jgi:hypothetical protein